MMRYLPLLPLILTGCSTFSGLDGSNKFACKAPDGITCTSVSGVYSNNPAITPATVTNDHASDGVSEKSMLPSRQPHYAATKTLHTMPSSGAPLLSPPRVLRIWIAPWMDQDGDLRDQAYLYVMWDRGDWNIQHSRKQILDQYAPVSLMMPGAQRNATAPVPPVFAPEQEAQSMVDKASEKPMSPEAQNAQ